MTFKFEIGEKVIVSNDAKDKLSVVSSMYKYFGKELTILKRWRNSLDEAFYTLEEGYQGEYHWNWPEDALEKIMKKEVKVDIKLKTQADCYKALLDGYILRAEDSMWAKLVDGKQVNDMNHGYVALYTFDTPEQWNVFEEVTEQWFDNIPESGILCKVRDLAGDKWMMDNIIGYNCDNTHPFNGMDVSFWKHAIPYTKEELQVFVDNAPI